MATTPQSSSSIQITKFIVHVTDPDGTLKPATLLTPLNPGSFPHTLFQRSIMAAWSDEKRRYARFNARSAVAASFKTMLGDKADADFVRESAAIAKLLHELMQQSTGKPVGQIKPGDIMLALIEKEGSSCLAIMKVDPALVQIRRVVEEGDERKVVFEEGVGLPSRSRSLARYLHKIALLEPQRRDAPVEHDLVLLDRDPPKGVAQFFYRDFLQCSLVRSARDNKHLLLARTDALLAAPGVKLHPKEKVGIRARATEIASEPGRSTVVLRDFVEKSVELPGRPEAAARVRKRFLGSFQKSTLKEEDRIEADELIPIEPAQVSAADETVTYKLDQDVILTGRAKALQDLILDDPQPDADGFYSITLRTKRFDLVRRR